MANEKIEKAAGEYAIKTANEYEVCNSEFVQEIAVAFEKATAFALSHQWIKVKEQLPEYNTFCMVYGDEELDCDGMIVRYINHAWYDGENFYDAMTDKKYHPEMWLPIPKPQI